MRAWEAHTGCVEDSGGDGHPHGHVPDWPSLVDAAVVLERAKGVLMEWEGCDASHALERLVAQALEDGESVSEVAYRIVLHMGE